MTIAAINELVAHATLARAVFVMVVLATPVLAVVLCTRRNLAWSLAGMSWVVLLGFTLRPVERELFERCALDWSVPTVGRIELLANVALFILPVAFLATAMRRPTFAFLVGAFTSAGIEAVQAFVPALGRSCDTSDWLANTIGAAIGASLVAGVLRATRRQSDVPTESP